MRTLFLLLALLPATAVAQLARVAPAWSHNAVMYEVNVRQFTPEGTFTALRQHLPRLKKLGVDVLWLMPVQPIGKLNRKGSLGSYYSIADYRAVNPEFGTRADFQAFLADAHRQGLRVIIDWVPNHTAFDHPWITQHPDWYVHKADGSVSNAITESGSETDWTDVAQLNYDNPELRRAMIGEMRWWLEVMKVDGFRCDFATGVPLDFWLVARKELVKAKPGVFLLAESESPALGEAFDASYAWEFHHLLNEVAQGKKPTSDIDAYLNRQKRGYHATDLRLSFTSNHDENSWNGTEFERMGANHQAAFVVAATLRNSMPLIYTGQEASLGKRLRFFEKDTVDWRDTSLTPFYRSIFELKHAQPALLSGVEGATQTSLKNDGDKHVYAFVRTRGASTVVVAVNFGDTPAVMSYQGFAQSGDYTDWFSKSATPLGAAGRIDIPAHGYRVLVRNSKR
ncbi:MAG: alpha-amylase family glycosyl hydrolase [Gemmatimonadota bacterium]